jgi:uncharacterized protein (DUF433 family)
LEEQNQRRPQGPCRQALIKGTRIAVEFILDLLADGWSFERILKNYPQINHEDILASLRYAAEALKEEAAFPLA